MKVLNLIGTKNIYSCGCKINNPKFFVVLLILIMTVAGLYSCKKNGTTHDTLGNQKALILNKKETISFFAPKIKSIEKVNDKRQLESISKSLMNIPIKRNLKIEKKMVLNPQSFDSEGEPPMLVTYQNNPLSTIVVNLGTYEGTQYQFITLVEDGIVIDGENFYTTVTIENDKFITKYLDPEGSELAQFTSKNGKLTAAVIHEQIQMKPRNFGSRWVKCVTRVGLHFTDGSFSGAASGLFCMAWGGYCAASIAVLCAGTAYYNIH